MHADVVFKFFRRVVAYDHRIFFLQLVVYGLYVFVADAVNNRHEVADRPVVDGPAQANLRFYLVAFRDGYVAHRIAEAAYLDVEAFVVRNGDVLPFGDFILYVFVFPVAVYDFVLQIQAGVDVAVFAVAVRALVEVHVIEVDRIVGDVVQILRCQMEKRFLQEHSAANPVFRRREGMHPGDDAGYVVVVVYVLHELRNAVGRRHDAFVYDLIGQLAAGIELVDHIFRIAVYVAELFFAIQILAAGDKPKFIIFYL